MKTYILMAAHDYESSRVLGVYSSMEKAEEALIRLEEVSYFDHYYIIEAEMDKDRSPA